MLQKTRSSQPTAVKPCPAARNRTAMPTWAVVTNPRRRRSLPAESPASLMALKDLLPQPRPDLAVKFHEVRLHADVHQVAGPRKVYGVAAHHPAGGARRHDH